MKPAISKYDPGANLFPGQYRDEETGLNQNYFRDYDPKTGRYIQADPIGLAGGMNPYSYANQNPLQYADPIGKSPTILGISALECLANPACGAPIIILTAKMIGQLVREVGKAINRDTCGNNNDCEDINRRIREHI